MMASRALAALGVPLGALVAAYLAAPRLGDVPASLSGLKMYAPHVAIAVGLELSTGFGRSHILKLVAPKLARAHCGVRIYRYGGEQFALEPP